MLVHEIRGLRKFKGDVCHLLPIPWAERHRNVPQDTLRFGSEALTYMIKDWLFTGTNQNIFHIQGKNYFLSRRVKILQQLLINLGKMFNTM
jgi:hypothetical protein